MSKKRKKHGLPPGSVVFTGNRKVDEVLISYLQYDATTLEEKVIKSHEKTILHESPKDKVDWYDIRGMHDTDLIEVFGSTFNIHPLVLEAAVDIHQRPKFDEYENGNFITLRAVEFDPVALEVKREHVAIFFYDGFLITVQETSSDLFETVRQRINSNSGRIRKRGADYLAYALIDSLVDNYYVVLDQMEEIIEALEEDMITNVSMENKGKIHTLKKELLTLRKSVAPLREAIGRFSKTDSVFVHEENYLFLRDLYEHTVQVMDSVESYRDILNGLQDLFISEVSFKMNKVMQLLTLISLIFIPLTFMAGIYGMNFDYIPELHYKYGYFVLLGVMLITAIVLIIFFRRKKWL